MQYRIVEAEGRRGPWRVTTEQYHHEYRTRDDKAMLSFDWHPGSRVEYPHLHVGPAVLAEQAVLMQKAHIPSGRISIEEVVRFGIEELGIVPLRGDWEQVLGEAQKAFEEWRSWPAPQWSRRPDS
jgi:hypothetical protein